MAAKKCFVISPIGLPDSEVREHADDVFEYIIEPAMEMVGIKAHRADHDQEMGRITDHMFKSILNDDLCIAVLSFQNPNVFYELAIAQSAARPVIILNQKGHPLPFDIKDLRVIEYTLRPKMIQEQVYVKQIVEMVRNLEAANWVAPVPFGPGLSPLGRARGDFTYCGRLEDYAPSAQWLAMIQGAERNLDLLGINLKYWTKAPGLPAIVEQRAAIGCRVRFLIAHPENPALPMYYNPSVTVALAQVGPDIISTNAFFRKLATAYPNVEVRQMRTGCHHQQLVRVDDRLFASLVMYSETTRRYPLIECKSPSSFFQAMVGEFDALWDANPDPPAPQPQQAPPSASTP